VSISHVPAAIRRAVESRAGGRCEYCLLPSSAAFFAHEVDHVIAEKHGGATAIENLALTCWRCNRHKGSDLGSFDPQTGAFSFLFNPRTQRWDDHFAVEEGALIGMTPEGRTTIRLLQCNSSERVEERRRLLAAGLYP
jgi:hypothetical protein